MKQYDFNNYIIFIIVLHQPNLYIIFSRGLEKLLIIIYVAFILLNEKWVFSESSYYYTVVQGLK